jgi:hypothetical protein
MSAEPTKNIEVAGKNHGNDNGSGSSEPSRDGSNGNNTFAMFVVAGMVASAAGFSAYSRHAGPMMRQVKKMSEIQGIRSRTISAKTATAEKIVSPSYAQQSSASGPPTKNEKLDIF